MSFSLTSLDPHDQTCEMPNAGLVCWSRMQAESGQAIELIIGRKEQERKAGGGVFFWGIGNPPPRGIGSVARSQLDVRVVFSVMKGRPKVADTSPESILVWNKYVNHNGRLCELPPHTLITSRSTTSLKFKKAHYALICRSDVPLILGDYGPFEPLSYRNAFGNKAPVGFSQVTALLEETEDSSLVSGYRANLFAKLTSSYWVKLLDPVLYPKSSILEMNRFSNTNSEESWLLYVREMRTGSNRETQPARYPEEFRLT